MADQQELLQEVQEFERNRVQLLTISNQRQQLQAQSAVMERALDELQKSQEKKVYKAVGNILVLSDSVQVKKELQEQKEAADLRVKSLQKQEDALIEKLNRLKSGIEAKAGMKPSGDATVAGAPQARKESR